MNFRLIGILKDNSMNIYRAIFFPIIILLLTYSTSYSDIGLSGTAYSEISLINQEELKYGNRSAMHLNMVSQSKGVKLVSELEFYTLYGYLSSISPEVAEMMKDGKFYIDRLYLKFPIRMVDVTLGKQRIAWGNGLLFRPTDRFNKPNPLSMSGRKEGVNALLAKAYISDLTAIEFVIAPADTFKEINGEVNLERLKYSRFATRYSTNYYKSDMAFSYQYNGETNDHIFGIDMKGDIKLGYHLETTFTYNNDSFNSENFMDYLQSVLGLDYSFLEKWIIIGEYFYNGRGMKKESILPISDFSLLDDFKYRHYLYSQITYRPDIFLNGSIIFIMNLVDKSLIISPTIGYNLFQNTDLQLYSQVFYGDETDEFSSERLGLNQAYYLKLTVKF
jgi:hypothetical protein